MFKRRRESVQCAGDVVSKKDVEILYLSPKPMPIAVPAHKNWRLHGEVGEVYMEVESEKENLNVLMRFYIGVDVIFIFVCLLFAVFSIVLLWGKVDPLQVFLEVIASPWVDGLLGLLVVSQVFLLLRSARRSKGRSIIRFNRQRREVVMVSNEGSEPLYGAWEEFVACIEFPKVYPASCLDIVCLRLGIRNAETGKVQYLVLDLLDQAEATQSWQYIRIFMEYGETYLPSEPGFEVDQQHLYLDESFKAVDELGSWYRGRFCSSVSHYLLGGKLPDRFATWAANLSKIPLPESVLKWSISIPSDQHSLPSDELQKKLDEEDRVEREACKEWVGKVTKVLKANYPDLANPDGDDS